ncbi:hypothetical protein LJY25_15965 [Hymenobacter sp. BT175]|uniref:hypothetical protein n=1 Tax=Hymenobacter translucens TaxID=2886507 RepID=UPI001D0DF274|nr:hypothetical protein [Hymenobacter translucens]MCC2547945.1 hypothetical protein [Hymenobacter translucens]
MYKTLLLCLVLAFVGAAPVSAACAALVTVKSMAERPRLKVRSGRQIHRPNYKQYRGEGSPYRGIMSLFR